MAPKVILGSILFNQTKLLQNIVEQVATDRAKGGVVHPGLKDGVGFMVPNAALIAAVVPPEAQACMKEVQQAILDGKISLPLEGVIGHQNAGKTIDPKSLIVGGGTFCLNKKS